VTTPPRSDRASPPVRAALATAPGPGAIAVIHLAGDVAPALAAICGAPAGDWPVGSTRVAPLGGVDRGVAARVAERAAILTPHGGPRVVERLLMRLLELGVELVRAADLPAVELFPEAGERVAALVLARLPQARTRAAVELLLDQPRRWREAGAAPVTAGDRERGRRLDRLLEPPLVVVAGPPNVGKSTLANALAGRTSAIALDRPGTTRDYTSAMIDLGAIVVRWHDTPGLRPAEGEIEERAIAIARGLMERADLLVAMTDAAHEWPVLPRPADLRVAAKADLGPRPGADLGVSGLTGEGLAALAAAVRDRLVPPADLAHPGRWVFDGALAGT
jgi:tRNA modification GTPase